MNFPAWDLNGINGGLLIAIIAVVHVFVAQLAVGGGFFLVMAEYKGHREGSARILKWVHRHTRFFLLLTMVFGGLTGVGIWLVISLVSPAGVSLLVREFLYAWAAEWVFFLGEIIALLLYAASFARCRDGCMAPRDHMLLGLGYCLFAFASLFIINGIVSFMLTPGGWVHGSGFWPALFNPGFWPSLTFRFGLSLVLAGMFGLITATAIGDRETREDMVRFCAQWICLPFILMVAGLVWYVAVLPESIQTAMQRRTADIRPFIRSFLDAAPLLFLAGMFLFIRLPQKAYRPYVILVLCLGLAVAGSFEWIRETARRPWLVPGHMYSSGITLADGQKMNEQGVFATSGWARLRVLGPDGPDERFSGQTFSAKDGNAPAQGGNAPAQGGNAPAKEESAPAQGGSAPARDDRIAGQTAGRAAGREAAPSLAALTPEEQERFGRFLFVQQCSSCHGLGAPMLNIVPRVKGRGEMGVFALLGAQGVISPYMPPFFGTGEERLILARWLAGLERTLPE